MRAAPARTATPLPRPTARSRPAASLSYAGESDGHGRAPFTLPSGVTILSDSDSEALDGVDDPHVRYLLFQKSIEHLPPIGAQRGGGVPHRRGGGGHSSNLSARTLRASRPEHPR